MRELWEKNEIYSTHPHDILIEDITIGNLTRNIDANDAGVRCSACYNIRIRNVHVESAAAAVAIFGGDCGFEFAPQELRPMAHAGYEIDGLSIGKAFRIGMVLNGLSDNVYRSSLSHAYQMQLDPAQPGLNGVVIRNTQLTGDGSPKSHGMFITAVSKVQLHNVTIKDFDIGVRMKDWINGLQFKGCDLRQNKQVQSISNSAATPHGVILLRTGEMAEYTYRVKFRVLCSGRDKTRFAKPRDSVQPAIRLTPSHSSQRVQFGDFA
jgi:hypothetical protein